MSGYQGYSQGQWPGGYDEGRAWVAPGNPPDGRYSEMRMADSAPVSRAMAGGVETYKRPAPYSGKDFTGGPHAKRTCSERGGLPVWGQGQDADRRRGMADEADRSRTFFVFNLMLKTTTSDLFKCFVKFGDLMKFHVFNNDEGKSTGSGVVQFVKEEAAVAAIAAQPHFIHKKQVIISRDQVLDPEKKESVKKSLEQHTLYVSDIPLDVSEEDLSEYFSQWGNISICDIVERAKRTRNSKYGFVSFANHGDAVKCLSITHTYRQTTMHVYMSTKWKFQLQPGKDSDIANGERYEEINKLFVTNIPDGVTHDELIEHFSMWGKLILGKICGSVKQNNRYGFVSFLKQEDALTALIMPHTLRNKRLFVRGANRCAGSLLEAAKDSKIMSAIEEKVKNCYIFVPTLNASVTVDELYEHFKTYGGVASCMIIPNDSRLTAFVAYVKENDAARCLNDIHFLRNMKLNVRRSSFINWAGHDTKASDSQASDAQASEPAIPARTPDPHEHASHANSGRAASPPRYDRRSSSPGQNRQGGPPRLDRRSSPPRYDRRASPPRQDRRPSPLMQNRQAGPPKQDRRPSPPRQNRQAGPPRPDRCPSPPRYDRHASPPRQDRRPSPPRQNRPAGPPRPDRRPSPPRYDRHASPPRQDRRPSPPRQDRRPSPPRQNRQAGPPRQNRQAGPPRPDRHPSPPRQNRQAGPPRPDRRPSPPRYTGYTRDVCLTRSAYPVPQNAESPNRKLAITGLAVHTPGYKLMCYFSRWGRVEDFEVVKDVKLRPTGRAFVIFEKHGDAEKAVSDKPHVIDDKEVKVTFANTDENLPSETFTSWREQRPHETIQQQRVPESVISLKQGYNLPEAGEPRRLLEDPQRQRFPEDAQPQRFHEDPQPPRLLEDAQPRKLSEDTQPRRLPEVYEPRRLPTLEPLIPGLKQVDSDPDMPLLTEYKCNVSGCSFKGKSGQFEHHWTKIHEAKVLYLICSFCSMGCVDADELRDHLDFFHGVEDKNELSTFLLGARQQERDNIHFIMPGSVTRETCMKMAEPPQKKDAKDVHNCPECTFTGTVDEFIDHWDKNHLTRLNYLRCPKCPKTFMKKDFLLLHIKNQHHNTEMKTEKEPKDIEDNSKGSQNLNFGSILLERAYHAFERQVLPRSETDIPTVSDIGLRSPGNRSMQTKSRVSLRAPLQCNQNVQRHQLPSQQPTPSVPPPLASQVPTQQVVHLPGQVTPFYPSTASVPKSAPPAPPAHLPVPPTAPQPPEGSQSYQPAYPQLTVPGILSTSTRQPVLDASRPAVSTQSYMVPPAKCSQSSFQPKVNAGPLQACAVTSPHSHVVASVAPSVVPLTSSQAGAPLQPSASAQPLEFEEQAPVTSKTEVMPSEDPSSILDAQDLTEFDMSNVKTQEKGNIQENVLETQREPEMVINKKVFDGLKKSVLPGSVLALRPEWTRTFKVAHPKKSSLDENTSEKKSRFTNEGKFIPKFDRTHPYSIQKFLLWSHIMMERLEDANVKVRRRLKEDEGESDLAEGDDDEDAEEVMELSSDEETGGGKSTAVKGTLSQAHEDMKARAQTVAQKVIADYRSTNRYTGAGKHRMIDRKVLGQLFQKSAGMIRYQSKRASVDADLVRQGISWVKQDITRILEQNKMMKCKTDGESKKANFSPKTDDCSQSFQQRTDKGGRAEKGRRDNHDWSRKEHQRRTENRGRASEDLQQRTGNGNQSRKECQQRTENRGRANEDLQRRTGNGARSRKEDNCGRASEDFQRRTANSDQSSKERQQRTDNSDQSRDKYQHRTENHGHSSEDLQRQTDKSGWSRGEFLNEKDWNVEKEEHVEVYMDEYVNEDEEYALAYVDEDGVHVMNDGFVMGVGGNVEMKERMDEETNDMYQGMEQGSRRKSIRREQDTKDYGGKTRIGQRNVQMHEGDQQESYKDGRFSQEQYFKYRDDDRTSFSSARNSSVSKRMNEDGRSQRFEDQMPSESVFAEEDEYFDLGNESFVKENEGFIPSERVVEVVNYNEHKGAFDTALTECAEKVGRILPGQRSSSGRVGRRSDRDRGYSNQHDSFKTQNLMTRGSQERGSRGNSKSSSGDKSVRLRGENRNRGEKQEIRRHSEHYRKDDSVTRNRKGFVHDGTTKSQKMRSKQTDDRDYQRNSGNRSRGDKASSSKSQFLKKEGVDTKTKDKLSSGNKNERKNDDKTEGNMFEWEQDDISEGALSGDGSLCEFDMDDIDMGDFVVMDEL